MLSDLELETNRKSRHIGNYQSTLRNISADTRPPLHRGGSQKSRTSHSFPVFVCEYLLQRTKKICNFIKVLKKKRSTESHAL